MTPQILDQLKESEDEIEKALGRSISDIPAAVSRAIAILELVRASAVACPSSQRQPVLRRLHDLRAKVALFSMVMARSEVIFQGYLRRADLSQDRYGPVGLEAAQREPALFSFSV